MFADVAPQLVLPPFNNVVLHTPDSVASNADVPVYGLKTTQRTGISGRFPSTDVHDVPPFVVSQTEFTPKEE